jgi:hypothetical protein
VAADDTAGRPPVPRLAILGRLPAAAMATAPGMIAIGLFVLWAEHDGGYDNDTWYWGALLSLALLAGTVVGIRRLARLSGLAQLALVLFGLYVAWSYLSMAWASAPGVALEGSNRALLYLLLFTLMLMLPWRRGNALAGLLLWAGGIGVLAVALMIRLAADDNVSSLLVGGRLASPTGYLNSTAALFTMGLLVSTGLATLRRLPGLLRGVLLALACAELQLELIIQSRGWLFTLPLILCVAIALVPDRLRVAAFAVLPVAGTGVILHRLLAVYQSSGTSVGPTAASAGRAGLLVCFAVFVIGTILAWGDWLARNRALSMRNRRALGTVIVVLVLGGGVAGGVAATHGHPVRFVVRQWNGFSHQERASTNGSHFADIGSGRYDFWRVSLHAFLSDPIGGLGQDNFDDYYIARARTGEEPSWTHSLELRLLAHTGAVGFLLFIGFLAVAVALALRGRRRADPWGRALVAIALFPLIVWVIHGSVDWFWEMPALSGPALGFLGLACSLTDGLLLAGVPEQTPVSPRPLGRRLAMAWAGIGVLAATLVLGFAYMSTRFVSLASDTAPNHPAAALADLRRAAELDPLSSAPDRIAGEIALQTGRFRLAALRFRQSLQREPGDWLSLLGSGLAASALGDRNTARRDFIAAYDIDRHQPANQIALERVDSRHPLTYSQALNLLSADD